jgi:hypothetical protein
MPALAPNTAGQCHEQALRRVARFGAAGFATGLILMLIVAMAISVDIQPVEAKPGATVAHVRAAVHA